MGRYHPSYREMQAAMEDDMDQVVEDRLREALGVNETVPLVDACEQLRRERDDAIETVRMEMAENLRLFDMLGLSKADDFGNDDSTTAVAKRVQLLLARLTRLRDAANECIEMLGWHADDDADPDNETPHDQTAHVNGLCRRILREAVEGSEQP